MKYFYIIQRNGIIHEVEDLQDRFMKIVERINQGGTFLVTKYGGEKCMINSADISNVFSENDYNEYVRSTKPKEYIKNGSWYDGKERRFLRHTAVKEAKIRENERKKKKIEDDQITPEKREMINRKLEEVRRSLQNKKII